MRKLIKKILKESEEDYSWVDPLYLGGISKGLMNFLIKEYRVWEFPSTHDIFPNKKYIIVDDKPRFIEDHKKYLVNKIYFEISEDFSNIPEPIVRRTIRQFLNDALAD